MFESVSAFIIIGVRQQLLAKDQIIIKVNSGIKLPTTSS
jgi:hypothetical protein